MADNNTLPFIIEEACEETGTSKAGILRLLNYYTKRCGWSNERATEYVLGLFENGTIEQVKKLR